MTRETISKADGRPNPPRDLTKTQRKIWRDVVASEPASYFQSPANQLLLGEFVCQVVTARFLSQYIAVIEETSPVLADPRAYASLLKLREQATRCLTSVATKLRLTNQSRYTPQAAATASKNSAGAKPWDFEG